MAQKILKNILLEGNITDAKHLVNKAYVDNAINRKTKDPVRVATTTNLEGTYSDKVLTLNEDLTTVDGVTIATSDRVLVKDQTDKTQNGIYVVTSTTTLTRADDFNTSNLVVPNCFIAVMEGTQQADTLFQLTTDAPITLDTTSLTFQKYSCGDVGSTSYKTTITGDGSATEFAITHNLNERVVDVSIYDSSYNECFGGVVLDSANQCTISFDNAPLSTESYFVKVIA